MEKIVKKIEDDPYLNFISVMRNYKVLERFLDGTIRELYRDRNKFYFKNFFYDKELYLLVKEEIESLYPIHKDIKLIISKHGVVIYDNYKPDNFNVLLLTIHSGTWVPYDLENKIGISKKERFMEEDIASDEIYKDVVLSKGGVWINNKLSRYVCDFNRSQGSCIYKKKKEKWLTKELWSELNKRETNRLYSWHSEFYETLTNLLETYNFNIIFDGHTMKHKPGRPKVSFGTRYIPAFYRPIVRSMRDRLSRLYKPILFNKPYSGGFILKWMKAKFPNRFVFSMEINKKLYMNTDMTKVYKRKIKKISENMNKIFDIK